MTALICSFQCFIGGPGGVIFAKYKNTKAEMAKEEKDGKMRLVLVVLRSKHFLDL